MVSITTTSKQSSSSTSIPLGVSTFKLSNPTIRYDEKYRKRRKQRKQQKLRQTFWLLGSAIFVLVFTWFTLWDEDSEIQQRKRPKLNRNSFQDLRKLQSDIQKRKKDKKNKLQDDGGNGQGGGQREMDDYGNNNGNSNGGVGFFGGMKQMFTKSDRQIELLQMLDELETKIETNAGSGIRWVEPGLLPALSQQEQRPRLMGSTRNERGNIKTTNTFTGWDPSIFFKIRRLKKVDKNNYGKLVWMDDISIDVDDSSSPKVDYTKHQYEYPTKLMEPPITLGDYPKLMPFKDLMLRWPQDDIDNPPTPFIESLIHFDYTSSEDIEAATKFRDSKLPFKFINVPEVIDAGSLWTDEYLTYQFDDHSPSRKYPPAHGNCQESTDNFFAFYSAANWPVERMGVPPTRNNDWTFETWSKHAKYADSSGLNFDKPHFYWQSGVDKEERYKSRAEWSFISRDLPSFSSPTQTNFVFNPDEQKGIQCRFGERGVSAATHFDSGRNMIAMMTGAKRYVLSPPKECSKLAIVNNRGNSIFRHSMLNFGHFNHMDNPNMPVAEREWLQRAGNAMAVDTVLKAGEVLYIPSHWFHYITSLQKSAQCNVRSGVDVEGDDVFGGREDVTELCEPEFKLQHHQQ